MAYTHSQDRKIIHNNSELKAVFGCDSISFTQIPQLINDHLLVPEPVEIQYTMRCAHTSPHPHADSCSL